MAEQVRRGRLGADRRRIALDRGRLLDLVEEALPGVGAGERARAEVQFGDVDERLGAESTRGARQGEGAEPEGPADQQITAAGVQVASTPGGASPAVSRPNAAIRA